VAYRESAAQSRRAAAIYGEGATLYGRAAYSPRPWQLRYHFEVPAIVRSVSREMPASRTMTLVIRLPEGKALIFCDRDINLVGMR
jgi:hypothetical protein